MLAGRRGSSKTKNRCRVTSSATWKLLFRTGRDDGKTKIQTSAPGVYENDQTRSDTDCRSNRVIITFTEDETTHLARIRRYSINVVDGSVETSHESTILEDGDEAPNF